MSNIKYYIDSLEVLQGEIKVRGWAFCEYGPKVEISVKGLEIKEFERFERVDVCEKFDEDPHALNTGFEFKIPNTNKFTIIFTAGDVKEEHLINVVKFNKKDSSLKILLRYIDFKSAKVVLSNLKAYGVKDTFYKIKGKISDQKIAPNIKYNQWYLNNKPTPEELDKQRKYKFDYNPKISIVVPTYNTKKQFLIEMIESVVNQTYTNWELCIADGASTLEETISVLKDYENKYKNIKVTFLNKNYMISGNTNEALKLVTGDYIGLFDHDDLLTEDALYEIVKLLNEDKEIDFIYTDEDKTDENTEKFFDPHFKPDWSPDLLTSYNYITHFTVFSKDLLNEVGNFNSEYDGSQDYDMFLRLTEKAKKISHIPKILYHWRVHSKSTASGIGAKSYCVESAKKALAKHLERIGEKGTVKDGKYISSYKIDYDIIGNPKISIVIPNKDEVETLKKCINSILKKTTYKNYEIIIVENNSVKNKTFNYYKEIEKIDNIRVIKWENEFNYSAINNFAVKQAKGEYILLLNNDMEVISKRWLEEMLMHAQRKNVGIVGAKLYYPDDSIQHAGVILGIGGVAGHSHKYFNRSQMGFAGRLKVVQNLSAVTAACLMVKKSIYDEVGGLDEGFKVAFNDVDFCMKVREKGYLCIFTPYAELYHYESKSRGAENTPEKVARFNSEIDRFESKWGLWIKDPYYNPNLTLKKEDFSLNEENNKKILEE